MFAANTLTTVATDETDLEMRNKSDGRACKEPTRVQEADNRMWLDMLVR